MTDNKHTYTQEEIDIAGREAFDTAWMKNIFGSTKDFAKAEAEARRRLAEINASRASNKNKSTL